MKNCPHCGDLMTNPRRVQCGKPDCKRAWKRHYMRGYFAAYRQTHGTPYTQRYSEKRRERDKEYQKRVPHWRQRHPDLAREMDVRRGKRKKLNTPGGESFPHEEIFTRDVWRCGPCGEPIDRTLRYPDPGSPSLDHVIPLSQGGAHTRANTRAAHLRCNVSRGARGGGEQLALL